MWATFYTFVGLRESKHSMFLLSSNVNTIVHLQYLNLGEDTKDRSQQTPTFSYISADHIQYKVRISKTSLLQYLSPLLFLLSIGKQNYMTANFQRKLHNAQAYRSPMEVRATHGISLPYANSKEGSEIIHQQSEVCYWSLSREREINTFRLVALINCTLEKHILQKNMIAYSQYFYWYPTTFTPPLLIKTWKEQYSLSQYQTRQYRAK